MIEFVKCALRELMGEKSFTEEISIALEKKLIRDFGGLNVYIKKSNRAEIHASVLREFNGHNRKELCQRYTISRSTFYRILKLELTASQLASRSISAQSGERGRP